MNTRTSRLVVAIAAALLIWSGCDRGSDNEAPQPARPRADVAQAAQTEGAGAVARIVFIDQEQACDCTMERIWDSWASLEAALGEGSEIPIERIHRDSQADQAEEYRLLRPMVTVPGIYFLDENGAIVELLQGLVTEAQVREALSRSE